MPLVNHARQWQSRSTDATITTTDTAVGTAPVGALSPSDTSARSISLAAPTTAGTYYYGACVDAIAGESDTANNCSDSVQMDVSEPQPGQGSPLSPRRRSDLVVLGVFLASGVLDGSPGRSFTLRIAIRNDGDAESAATALRFYRSTNPTITTTDISVGTVEVGAIAASGGTSSVSLSLTAPSTAGWYYYGACVDAVTRRVRHHQQLLARADGHRGRASTGLGCAGAKCERDPRGQDVLANRDGRTTRALEGPRRQRVRYKRFDRRHDHDIRHDGGHGRGQYACPFGRLRGNDQADGADDGWHGTTTARAWMRCPGSPTPPTTARRRPRDWT